MTASADLQRIIEQAAGPLREVTGRLTAAHRRLDEIQIEKAKLGRQPVDAGEAMRRLQADVEHLASHYRDKTARSLLKRYAQPEPPDNVLTLFTRVTPQGRSVPNEGALACFFGDIVVKTLARELEGMEIGGLTDRQRKAALTKLESEEGSLRSEIAELQAAVAAAGGRVAVQ